MSKGRDYYYRESLHNLQGELYTHTRLSNISIAGISFHNYSRILHINCQIGAINELREDDYTRQQDGPIVINRTAEEIAAISQRALMIERISRDISFLPQLPTVLWKEIAEYEGGEKSSLLGKVDNNNENGSLTCCSIL